MSLAERRVRFIIGGVQKGGTTALFDYCRRDLPVCVSSIKETHFFDDETQDWSQPDYAAYHALFNPDDPRPWGEATPIYLYWPQSLERIAAYSAQMRLIFLFRDPVERAWSHWRMESGRDAESVSFSKAIRAGRERVATDPQAPGHHRVYSYVERGFYGAQLARALDLFPREQLLLLRSSDLDRDPSGVLRRVAEHVGVTPPIQPIQPLRANVGRQAATEERPTAEDESYLRSIYAEDAAMFRRLSGLDL